MHVVTYENLNLSPNMSYYIRSIFKFNENKTSNLLKLTIQSLNVFVFDIKIQRKHLSVPKMDYHFVGDLKFTLN